MRVGLGFRVLGRSIIYQGGWLLSGQSLRCGVAIRNPSWSVATHLKEFLLHCYFGDAFMLIFILLCIMSQTLASQPSNPGTGMVTGTP